MKDYSIYYQKYKENRKQKKIANDTKVDLYNEQIVAKEENSF